MEFFTLVTCVAIAIYILKLSEERRRIALLGSHLGQYQIEKLMETLTDGYLRALGEKDAGAARAGLEPAGQLRTEAV